MYRVQYIIFYSFALLIIIIPRRLRHAIFKGLASFLYLILKSKRKIIYANLDLVFKGQMDQKQKDMIGKICFQNLIIEVITIIEIYFTPSKKLYKTITTKNTEVVDALKKENKAIIYVIYHYNNLELGGLALSSVSSTKHVVQPAKNPYIDAFVKHSRERHGIKTIPMKKAVRHLAIQLKNGHDISLVIDQGTDIHDGIMIKMFGETTSHIGTASFLARKFDAVLVPLQIKQENSFGCELIFKDPIPFTKTEDEASDISYLTQAQATILEKMIIEDPAPWFWCHKRWKDTHPEIYS
jgi:KDO2-lipid IV(A) lauroyltransferase